jgi:hypothetical protein
MLSSTHLHQLAEQLIAPFTAQGKNLLIFGSLKFLIIANTLSSLG